MASESTLCVAAGEVWREQGPGEEAWGTPERNRKDPPKETPWEPSTEQNGAGREQIWHKAVQEKKGSGGRGKSILSVSPRNRRGLCEAA